MSRPVVRHNLHTHTHFSDGLYSAEEVVAAAVEQGLAAVGICDHFQNRKLPPGVPSVGLGEIEFYAAQVRALAAPMAPRIRVLVGLEISAAADESDLEAIDWQAAPFDHLDYVLFESVADPHRPGLDLSGLAALRPFIHVPVGLAHCDLAGAIGAQGIAWLLDTLEANRIFVELCASARYAHWMPAQWVQTPPSLAVSPQGLAAVSYYHASPELYSRIAHRDIWVSVGTDMHDDLRDLGRIQDALDFIRQADLGDQLLIDRL